MLPASEGVGESNAGASSTRLTSAVESGLSLSLAQMSPEEAMQHLLKYQAEWRAGAEQFAQNTHTALHQQQQETARLQEQLREANHRALTATQAAEQAAIRAEAAIAGILQADAAFQQLDQRSAAVEQAVTGLGQVTQAGRAEAAAVAGAVSALGGAMGVADARLRQAENLAQQAGSLASSTAQHIQALRLQSEQEATSEASARGATQLPSRRVQPSGSPPPSTPGSSPPRSSGGGGDFARPGDTGGDQGGRGPPWWRANSAFQGPQLAPVWPAGQAPQVDLGGSGPLQVVMMPDLSHNIPKFSGDARGKHLTTALEYITKIEGLRFATGHAVPEDTLVSYAVQGFVAGSPAQRWWSAQCLRAVQDGLRQPFATWAAFREGFLREMNLPDEKHRLRQQLIAAHMMDERDLEGFLQRADTIVYYLGECGCELSWEEYSHHIWTGLTDSYKRKFRLNAGNRQAALAGCLDKSQADRMIDRQRDLERPDKAERRPDSDPKARRDYQGPSDRYRRSYPRERSGRRLYQMEGVADEATGGWVSEGHSGDEEADYGYDEGWDEDWPDEDLYAMQGGTARGRGRGPRGGRGGRGGRGDAAPQSAAPEYRPARGRGMPRRGRGRVWTAQERQWWTEYRCLKCGGDDHYQDQCPKQGSPAAAQENR